MKKLKIKIGDIVKIIGAGVEKPYNMNHFFYGKTGKIQDIDLSGGPEYLIFFPITDSATWFYRNQIKLIKK